MNLIECLKSIFGSGSVFTEADIVRDERDTCGLCRRRRLLAPAGEMWYDAPVEEVLGGWLVSESYICLCFPCTRDYLFQGQLKRREFNGYRN